MAQRNIVMLVDDIDGSEADETVTFGLDGVSYEIDLTRAHAAELRAALASWIESGRRTGGRKAAASAALGSRTSGRRPRSETEDMRAWARANGYEVKDRGRVPADVVAAYEARR